MGSMKKGWKAGVSLFLFAAVAALGAQSGGAPSQSTAPASSAPQQPSSPPAPAVQTPDHAGSYYHYMLGRRYEELAGIYNSEDDLQRAIAEYKQAIADDPSSLFLRVQLAELYWRVTRVADAIREAQAVLKQNPNDVDAHRLLAHIYVSVLGSSPSTPVSHEEFNKAIKEFETVTRLDPSDTESFLLLGRLYRMDNQNEKAEATFKQLLESHPDVRTARVNLAQLYSDQGEYGQAVKVLKQVPESDMDSGQLYMLGYDELQAGQSGDAETVLQKALGQDSSNQDIMRAYAEALMANGKTGLAQTQLEKVIQANPEDPRAYARLAQLDRQEGRWDDARKQLAQAHALAPSDPEIAYQQALLETTLGNDDQAIGILNGLLKQFTRPDGQYTPAETNNRAIFLERLGLIYRTEEKYDQALAEFRPMLPLGDAQAPRGEALIIETLELGRQPAAARAEAEAALKKYPSNRQLVIERATLLGQQGRADEAVQQLQGLLKNQSSDREIELAIAQVYSQAKRYPEAEGAVQKALALTPNPEDQEYALFMLGSVYEREKRYNEAETEFKKVLALDPLNGSAANYLGYMLAERGVDLDESVKYIQQALKLDPNNGAYLDSLGWAYYKMNRFAEAEGPLERAAKQLSDDPTVLDHLGHVYLRLGKKAQAQQEWERALAEWPGAVSSDFTDRDAARLRKELKQLKRALAQSKNSQD